MARPTKAPRPNGVYDRGGAWQVRIKRQDAAGNLHRINQTFPYDVNAPARHPHSRAAIQKKAQVFAATERSALHVEKRPAADLLGAQTLGAWLKRYETEVCPHKKSGPGDVGVCRLIRERFPTLCSRPVSELKSHDFGMHGTHSMGMVLDRDYFLAPATIVRCQAVVSQVFTVAAKQWGFAIANPVLSASKPSVDNSRDRTVSSSEWNAIQDSLAGAHPATRAAIAFLRWTACRRGEAVKLRWEDVRLDEQPVATFLDTKTPKTGEKVSRTIPLPPQAIQVLRTLMGDASPPARGPVFALEDGRAVRPDSLTQAWARACASAGVDGATLHDLRHTRTTELANLLPLQKVMRLTGHKSPAMLMRYYNPKPEDLGTDVADAEAEAEARKKKRSTPKSTKT